MARIIRKDENGRVIEVAMDQRVDANSEYAVQIPPEADGSREHPLAYLLELSPNEIAELSAEERAEVPNSHEGGEPVQRDIAEPGDHRDETDAERGQRFSQRTVDSLRQSIGLPPQADEPVAEPEE